jgi:hypothetical protein
MAQFSQARSEEVGDLGMKRSKALVLLAMFVLGFCILSEAQSTVTTVKIIPAAPTSADEVSVAVKVAHSDFSRVSFSRLHHLSQQVFLAIVSAEPVACLAQPGFEALGLSESTHTYQLGRLNPGRYQFQIQYCFPGCPSPPDDATMLRLIDLWIKQAKV